MALRRRVPGGGAPGESDPITGESQLPGVRDTRAGLGGGDEVGPMSDGGAEVPDKGKIPGMHEGRFGESPRERPQPGLGGGGPHGGPPQLGAVPTPPGPTEPVPMGGLMPPPMEPFAPMPSQDPGSLINPAGAGPQRRSLFGSMGGLKGGGLGVPLDPVSNQESDPITMLLQKLRGGGGGGGGRGGGFGSF